MIYVLNNLALLLAAENAEENYNEHDLKANRHDESEEKN